METWKINKYWLKEECGTYKFCKKGRDNLDHFIGECEEIRGWFDSLGRNKEEKMKKICNDVLDKEKGKVVIRLWKDKEKMYKKENGLNIE